MTVYKRQYQGKQETKHSIEKETLDILNLLFRDEVVSILSLFSLYIFSFSLFVLNWDYMHRFSTVQITAIWNAERAHILMIMGTEIAFEILHTW